ncbi:hypothetical protein DXX94_15985 [Thalassotalea euphylliae]|uniref:Methylamine utilization protein n=1 Tax=Thalassotalea euphylliae TaxID=1655234 RepID=A0A3E0U565_9GAMM|nr:hypothetical protein DXX94_15985 [Thalassotalea euphylliae]
MEFELNRLFIFFACALSSAPLWANNFNVQVLNKSGQPQQDIVVFVTPTNGIEGLAANTEQLIVDQKGKKFAPYLSVMQKGQTIQFSNRDDITHHIYSVSGENRFEFKLKAGKSKNTEAMQATEEIAMGCNIHDWMSGYALVVDTPYFGKTNGQGIVSFVLANLGEYQVSVWHPQLDNDNRQQSSITVINESTLSNTYQVRLADKLLPIPLQENQEEFDFLEEY